MLLQEALNELKLTRSKITKITEELKKYSVWSSCNPKHPWGIKGDDKNYSIDTAKEEVKSKLQAVNDLLNNYLNLKTAIDYTNMITTFELAGQKVSIAQAIIIRREFEGVNKEVGYASLKRELFEALKNATLNEQHKVSQFNYNIEKNQMNIDKAEIIYLFDPKKMGEEEEKFEEFLSNLDAKLQILNATTELVYPA